jgi:hypothetical protein
MAERIPRIQLIAHFLHATLLGRKLLHVVARQKILG